MVEFIAHRINTRKQLKQLKPEYGAEIDLRDWQDQLILQHDPFVNGEYFQELLQNYKHGTLVLNVKSERIEWQILEKLKSSKVSSYFFLDSSFPMIMAMIEKGVRDIALRYSEREGLDTLAAMRGQVSWVWVDCFTEMPLNYEITEVLKAWGYRLCLVSPDLVGRPEDISVHAEQIRNQGLKIDAICTKVDAINIWKKLL